MLVSFYWLKEFVDTDLSAEEVADLLTMGGIEVDAVTHVGRNLDSIVTALIEEIDPHPSAERLSIARLNLGNKTVSVVCGASNIAKGQIVPYAGPGAVRRHRRLARTGSLSHYSLELRPGAE